MWHYIRVFRSVLDGAEQRIRAGEALRPDGNSSEVEVHVPRRAVQRLESLLRDPRD